MDMDEGDGLPSFEQHLSVSEEESDWSFAGQPPMPQDDFWLNPRHLRGSDFLMRWSQGEWSEKRLIQAVNDSKDFAAIPYGPSGVAPEGDVRAFELYFERLEAAGLGQMKRPDVLIVRKSHVGRVERIVERLGGEESLPFTPEDYPDMQELLSLAIVAIECENSLWVAKRMPAYAKPLTPQKRLNGELGLPKNAVAPTIIMKEQDRTPLRDWQVARNIPIHIWHAFYDLAFGLSFDTCEELIRDGKITPIEQVFQALEAPRLQR